MDRVALSPRASTALASACSVAAMALPRRTPRWLMRVSISFMAGATDSAAAVGVEQRLSETMSQIDVSGSWPIPVITGTGQAATARASCSSLKHMRSSKEPPPRTSRIASGREAAATSSARMMVAGACFPCTAQPTASIWTSGFLLRNVRLTSSITLPESDVTTQTRVQKAGMCRLQAGSMSPSRSSLRASSATCWRRSPSPATVMCLATNESLPVFW